MIRRTLPVLTVLVVLATATPLHAQAYRGWLDVNFIGASSAQDEQVFSTGFVFRGTALGIATAYPELPAAKGAEVGGGVQLHRMFGVGVQWDRATYEYLAGIGLSGSRLFSSVDEVTTEPLERTQNAININGVFIAPTPDAWRIRVFGGPTYFSATQEMVSDFTFFDVLGLVEIGDYVTDDVEESGWGFNVGADVSYFFTRVVGVGGVIRFNRGTLSFIDPLTEETGELNAGHTIYGAGLRLRF